MALCPEAEMRTAMIGSDFWAYVFRTEQPDWRDDDGPDESAGIGQPCEVCGEAGACGYDTEGRPMIHTTESTEDGEQ